mmetsp:Transcript_62083/g.102486  ORF Transcript_62083/g.102486 Transcript_62083/m.102486 type:complete len:120 (+) Transcript_62083:1668-2027(+)
MLYACTTETMYQNCGYWVQVATLQISAYFACPPPPPLFPPLLLCNLHCCFFHCYSTSAKYELQISFAECVATMHKEYVVDMPLSFLRKKTPAAAGSIKKSTREVGQMVGVIQSRGGGDT